MTDSGKLFQAFIIRVQKHFLYDIYGWLPVNYDPAGSTILKFLKLKVTLVCNLYRTVVAYMKDAMLQAGMVQKTCYDDFF